MKSLSSLCLDASLVVRSRHTWFELFQAALLVASAFLFVLGGLAANPVIMAFGVFALYGFGLCFICHKLSSRILLLFLFIGIFLFWLTRPLIGMFYQTDAWFGATFDSTAFALGSIYLSIASLLAGSALYERFRRPALRVRTLDTGRANEEKDRLAHVRGAAHLFNRVDWLKAIQYASLVAYVVCFAGAVVYGAQMLSYMRGLSYEEYYLTSTTAYASSTLSSIAGLAPSALCVYLATMPRRSLATTVLIANILTTLPKLIIGARTDFVMAALFLVFYYLVRNARDGRGSWIGKKEIALLLVALPVGIIFLGALNYIRAGGGISTQGLLMQVADALHKQGVTFKVLEYGYEVEPLVSDLGFKCYSLGSLLTTVTQGFVGQLFLGCELLPDINSAALATRGFSYAHAMSFFAHSNYLGGEGYGSSYTLELNADFGIGGIVLGSLFLGFLFTAMASWIGKGWLSTTIIFMAARRVFHMPRGEFIEWASCLWSTRFWLVIVLIVFLALAIAVFLRREKGARVGALILLDFPVLSAPDGLSVLEPACRSASRDRDTVQSFERVITLTGRREERQGSVHG